MNQGKIIVGIAVFLGICAGLAGYWWNYGVSRRAMEFWGQENARLIRLAPKVEYLAIRSVLTDSQGNKTTTPGPGENVLNIGSFESIASAPIDLSNARGLIHLRHAILSDDQYSWNTAPDQGRLINPDHALKFTDGTSSVTIYFDTFDTDGPEAALIELPGNYVRLGPLAKSLEQFLARELPRLEQEAAATNKQELAPQ